MLRIYAVKVAEGEEVIVDGAYGEVFVNPTPITLKIYNKTKKGHMMKELRNLKTI